MTKTFLLRYYGIRQGAESCVLVRAHVWGDKGQRSEQQNSVQAGVRARLGEGSMGTVQERAGNWLGEFGVTKE